MISSHAPRRSLALTALVTLLAACDGPASPTDAGVMEDTRSDAFVEPDAYLVPDAYVDPPCTTLLEDPDDGLITTWPEVALVESDATTETGLRLRFRAEDYPTLADTLGGYLATLTDDLSEVDGFGINAEVVIQFGRHFDTALLPTPEQTAGASAPLGIVVVEPGPPRLVPVLVTTTDVDRTLLLAPAEPLPPHARVAAFVTQGLQAAARGCIESSPSVTARLGGALAPDEQAALAALVELGVVADASDLVTLVAYPTQSIVEDALAVREDIAAHPPSWTTPPTCVVEAEWTRCDGVMHARTYQDPADGVIRRDRDAPAPMHGTYEIPVTIWLPPTGEGPFRTLIYGHGLTGTRDQAEALAHFAAPLGIATAAIDAPEHGEHPSAEPGHSELDSLLGFFAINSTMLRTRALEAARLRDNFQAAAFDRLQLVALLSGAPDVDDDGTVDLDVAQMAYLGVSLGGIMGAQHIALDDHLDAGVLVVGGGRVSAIISDSAMFGSLVTLLRPRSATDGDVRRFFPILQTILERGDAASWAPYVTRDALEGEARDVDVLLGVVLDDEIVPNVSNYTLARAFGMPLVEPVLRPVPAVTSIPAPLRGNVREGRATAGLLQFDVVGDGRGGTETATHGNVGDSDVGADAWLDFLTSHWDDGPARVRDPYAAIGLSHASP